MRRAGLNTRVGAVGLGWIGLGAVWRAASYLGAKLTEPSFLSFFCILLLVFIRVFLVTLFSHSELS